MVGPGPVKGDRRSAVRGGDALTGPEVFARTDQPVRQRTRRDLPDIQRNGRTAPAAIGEGLARLLATRWSGEPGTRSDRSEDRPCDELPPLFIHNDYPEPADRYEDRPSKPESVEDGERTPAQSCSHSPHDARSFAPGHGTGGIPLLGCIPG